VQQHDNLAFLMCPFNYLVEHKFLPRIKHAQNVCKSYLIGMQIISPDCGEQQNTEFCGQEVDTIKFLILKN
jgi:hypothetical protein